MTLNGTDIFIGGAFNTIGYVIRNSIARINNSTGDVDATWNPNANGNVYSIVISGNDIFVGGAFTNIGSQTRNYIAKLNNSTGAADATWNPNSNNTVIVLQ